MGLVERKIEGDKVTCLYESTNILQTEYHKYSKTLEIVFKTGIKYRYYNVTEKLHDGMVISESAGKYFNSNIRPLAFEKIGTVFIGDILNKIKNSKL